MDHVATFSVTRRNLLPALKKLLAMEKTNRRKNSTLEITLKLGFPDITVLKKSLRIFIKPKAGQSDDPKNTAQNVSSIGHWGNGDYQIQVENDKNLEYIMSLVKQIL